VLGVGNALSTLYLRLMARFYDREALARWLIVAGLSAILGVGTMLVYYLSRTQVAMFYGAILAAVGILALGNVKRWLLGFIIADIAIQFDSYLYWDFELGDLGTIAGLPISLSTMFIVVLYGMWFFEAAATRRPRRERPLLRTGAPLIPYLAAVALSMITAARPLLSYFELVMLIQVFLITIYVGGALRTREDVRFVLVILMLTLAMESVVVILSKVGISLPLLTSIASNPERPTGSFGSPNLAGAYLGVNTIIAFSVLLMPVRWFERWLALGSGLLGLTALVFTLSRGGWIAFAIASVVFIALAWRRGWIPNWFLITLLIVALVGTLPLQGVIIQRLTGDDGGAASDRGALMIIALEMVQDRPLLGIGANNFAAVMPNYIGPDIQQDWIYTVHNKYLLVWAETGTIGFLGFLFFLFYTLWRGARTWRFHDRLLSVLGLAITAAILGHMVHLQVDIFNARSPVTMLWMLSGLIYALIRIRRDEKAVATLARNRPSP
jgi:O-antigen ligase